MRTQGSPEVLEERRRIAARLFEQDYESKAIAQIVGVHAQTVRAWRREYGTGGLRALDAKPHPGPPCKLDEDQKQQLLRLLAEPPTAYGYEAHLWTTKLIATLIEQRFGVDYHHDHVGVMLRQLGYSYQKPAKRAKERDEQKITEWREQAWPRIARESRDRHATVAFIDEAGFSMIPSIKKQWAPRGQTPVVEHRNRWFRKVSVIGALTVSPDRLTMGLLMNWHPGAHIDQLKVVDFLQHLCDQAPGPIDVVWDNLSSHGGKAVRAFLEQHPALRLHRLPPYAPELNPIENVWCLSKYHRLANHGITDLEQLHERSADAVNQVARQPALLRSAIQHAGLADALWPASAQ